VYVVDNAGDDLAAVRHINACGGPAEHRAVLRPTPGAGDVLTTGWDLLVCRAVERGHGDGVSVAGCVVRGLSGGLVLRGLVDGVTVAV